MMRGSFHSLGDCRKTGKRGYGKLCLVRMIIVVGAGKAENMVKRVSTVETSSGREVRKSEGSSEHVRGSGEAKMSSGIGHRPTQDGALWRKIFAHLWA